MRRVVEVQKLVGVDCSHHVEFKLNFVDNLYGGLLFSEPLQNDIWFWGLSPILPGDVAYSEFSLNNSKLKAKLSGLKQFIATESSLKMMKTDFYFTLKAFFPLDVFKFLF